MPHVMHTAGAQQVFTSFLLPLENSKGKWRWILFPPMPREYGSAYLELSRLLRRKGRS